MVINMISENTKYFLDFIFPDRKIITRVPKVNYEINAIKFKAGAIYGTMGSGKTEIIRSMTEKAVKKYGKENVNCVECGTIDNLVTSSLDDKLVQILTVDDITLQRIEKESVNQFFKLRHIWKDQIDRNYGYILAILGTHRFHGIQPPELRTNLDMIIFKNSATSPFDRSIVKKYVTEDGIILLETLEKLRDDNPMFMNQSVFWTRGKVGSLILPMAEDNYIRKLPNTLDDNVAKGIVSSQTFWNKYGLI